MANERNAALRFYADGEAALVSARRQIETGRCGFALHELTRAAGFHGAGSVAERPSRSAATNEKVDWARIGLGNGIEDVTQAFAAACMRKR